MINDTIKISNSITNSNIVNDTPCNMSVNVNSNELNHYNNNQLDDDINKHIKKKVFMVAKIYLMKIIIIK